MQWTVALEGGPRRVNHAAVAIGDRAAVAKQMFNGGVTAFSQELTEREKTIGIVALMFSPVLTHLWNPVMIPLANILATF
ncbi:hypothetical protein ANCDUO_08255 [Ancylostoma duodenale]|uniref:Uncharacterized protein n=1 Tax=Ancylostoma duodenale TaxID=51022 RepID=A0A0C2GWI5_9BILA|nr:hypothetical protein ANCDUO_08255 [Ancylostoma duodenale]